MDQSQKLLLPATFSEDEKLSIINQTINTLEKIENLNLNIKSGLIIPTDGFEADSFVEDTISLEIQGAIKNVNCNNTVYVFTFHGTGDVKYNEPASGLPHTCQSIFTAISAMEPSDNGLILRSLSITSLHR